MAAILFLARLLLYAVRLLTPDCILVFELHSINYMNTLVCISRQEKKSPIFFAAAAVLVLNLLDAIFTLVYIQLGAAVEANPIMAIPLSFGPFAFMLAKLGMVSICIAFLWKLRHKRSATAGIYTAALAYSLLLVYHVSAIPGVLLYLENK